MPNNPVFIDSAGMTIRFEPPSTSSPTACAHITLSERSYYDNDQLVHPARIFDFFITADAALQLADTLRAYMDPELNQMLDINSSPKDQPIPF